MRNRYPIGLAAAMLLGACTDGTTPIAPSANVVAEQESEGRGAFQRYVALGTSVSMGWQSDGVVAATQRVSWPAQLAGLAGREMTLPLIADFGCKAPIAAPLAGGLRISGEPITVSDANAACGGLLDGITLPTQNVAIIGATTQAALFSTPESMASHALLSRVYSRVLPPGTTQLQAAVAQNPKVVSIELGANEVLASRNGLAVIGQTLFPVPVFQQLYTTLTEGLRSTKYGVLVGLIDDVADFPSFRYGSEIWADQGALLQAFHVAVSGDCQNSDNLVFVAQVIPLKAAMGAAARRSGQSPVPLSCADVPGTADYIVTPAEATLINTTMQQMDAIIAQRAQELGFARFRLDALYGMPNLKGTFSSIALMTSPQPYGPYISLDGIHPSAQGHSVLASAAARAINARYGLGIPEASGFIASR